MMLRQVPPVTNMGRSSGAPNSIISSTSRKEQVNLKSYHDDLLIFIFIFLKFFNSVRARSRMNNKSVYNYIYRKIRFNLLEQKWVR
jgi:hypothetical protein